MIFTHNDDDCSAGIDRAETLCEGDSRREYLDLINSELPWLFPEFVQNLHTQSPHEREMSRAAVIEYKDAGGPSIKVFKNSKALQHYLETSAVQEIPKRRLFLLEDLSLNYITSLGSELRIPPSFFGAHWGDPARPTFNYRNPFSAYSPDLFLIRYASTEPVRVDAPSGLQNTIYRCNSNVNRHIHCYDNKSPVLDQPKCYRTLSYWTSSVMGDGSWDAVLIVDPPIGDHVKSITDGTVIPVDRNSTEHAYSRMHSLSPDLNDLKTLSHDASTWNQGSTRPNYNSIFDDILVMTQSSRKSVDTPRASTEIARKLVISTFITFLRRRILNMLRLHSNPNAAVLHVNRCDYLRQFGTGMLSSWHHELFGFVTNVKYIMGIMAQEVEDNVVALGLGQPQSSLNPIANAMASKANAPSWELAGWTAIRADCSKIIAMADAFLVSYLQFTSMQEAQAANKNALSLARITNLTIIFIPLSTIAAIFSMTDEYVPGRERGWVFWVTALPVVAIMCILTSDALWRWWTRGKGWWMEKERSGSRIPFRKSLWMKEKINV